MSEVEVRAQDEGLRWILEECV